MGFIARRNGMCSKCNQIITANKNRITWSRKTGQAYHVECNGKPTSQTTVVTVSTPIADATRMWVDETIPEVKSIPDAETAGSVERAIRKLVESVTPAKQSIDEKAVKQIVSDSLIELFPTVKTMVQDEARNVLQANTRTLEIKTSDGKTPVKFDKAHKNLETLIKLVNTSGATGHRMNVYMYGPAGSGKSTGARQACEAVELMRFGYTSLNPMTPESRVLGYMHAGGEYVPTEFFKCYTEGGLFCFDEIDNASSGLVTTLNSLLENGHGAFPHGVFKRHPDFICVCTANTIGRGGDIHYPERRALDSAFLERFVFLEWDYDDALTHGIVTSIIGDKANELISWVDRKGNEYKARYPELVISPRAYIQSAVLQAAGFDRDMIETAAIRRGLQNA